MSDNYSLEYKVIPNLFAQYTQKKIPLNMLVKITFMQMILMGKKICWSKIKIDLYDEQIQPAAPDGCRFIAYTFPPVKEVPEAKWGVIDLMEKKYYTFEAGSDDTWFIGSMEGNIHKNYGTSNDMSKTEFVEYVKKLSQDNSNPNK